MRFSHGPNTYTQINCVIDLGPLQENLLKCEQIIAETEVCLDSKELGK